MDTDTRTPVTVIGLGAMGAALAGGFLKAGHPTTVWNRSAQKADALVARGATRAATVAEAVSASPLVVVCVLDYAAAGAVLTPVERAMSSRVLVNLTTGTPREARRLAAWAAECGAAYLDGAIMAVPRMIGGPEALLLYCGSADAFAAREGELASLGASRYLGADPGLASLYDLALLSAMYGMLGGFLHAVALAGTEQVAATELTSLVVPWLDAMAADLPHLAGRIEAGDFATDGSTLDLNRAGVDLIARYSREQGVDAGQLAPLRALLDRRVAEGHGADGFASLIEALRRR
jgi:3-hydroxyisobutyrate dehydrogenase-like beta-hydroxyacid dehydrogenase